MRKSLNILFLVLLAAVSCGPSQYAVNVEMRYPSKSGLDLSGKSFSVAYMESADAVNNAFTKVMADGFAYSLEQKYALADGAVGVYALDGEGGVYSGRDSLVSLLMNLETDVIFLFDAVDIDVAKSGSSVPFAVKLHCYDSMNKADKVFTYGGNSALRLSGDIMKSVETQAWEAGKTVSAPFEAQWKHEQYSILFFETENWYKALEYAAEYKWKQAVDIWMGLLSSRDILKRAAAEYNIAVAMYLSADYDLALKWLDQSDAENKLPLSDGLRKRIMARK